MTKDVWKKSKMELTQFLGGFENCLVINSFMGGCFFVLSFKVVGGFIWVCGDFGLFWAVVVIWARVSYITTYTPCKKFFFEIQFFLQNEELFRSSLSASPFMKPLLTPGGWQVWINIRYPIHWVCLWYELQL